ncbi:hypothetical protein DRF75_02195 [Ehrlichia minasensis]|uniref:Uncharacterized protein n=1 Tax=Ehrlichia minasensis TaxID=1242993 RepID=A0A4Q6I4N0_9RICK|nr:hypothetical protein DRF75_02195 [Ehrlichia minasensis]
MYTVNDITATNIIKYWYVGIMICSNFEEFSKSVFSNNFTNFDLQIYFSVQKNILDSFCTVCLL